MTLPIHSDFNGLGWSFCGQPFCDVAVPPQAGSFHGLNTAFRGVPFAGTIGFRGTLILEATGEMSAIAIAADVFFEPPETRTLTPDLNTLDISYLGTPFVEGFAASGISFFGLDIGWRGNPFVVTSVVLPEITEITPPAAIVDVVASETIVPVIILDVVKLISLDAYCTDIAVVSPDVTIASVPGRIDVSSVIGLSILIYPAISICALSAGIVGEPIQFGRVDCPSGNITVDASCNICIVIPTADATEIYGQATATVLPAISGSAMCAAAGACRDVVGTIATQTGTRKIFECMISANGYDSVLVPISAFQSRQRAGDPSYSEVTIPGMAAIQNILDRQTGSFTIYVAILKAGIILQREILFSTAISSISITGNPRDQSITLSGYQTTEPPEVPAQLTLVGVNYTSFNNGSFTIRKPDVDLYLKPGDIVTYEEDTFEVELITYTMSAMFGTSMEIKG